MQVHKATVCCSSISLQCIIICMYGEIPNTLFMGYAYTRRPPGRPCCERSDAVNYSEDHQTDRYRPLRAESRVIGLFLMFVTIHSNHSLVV
jgi:hypothetical protein